MERSADIRRAILETVVFFDLFDYPLTDFEIWQYLPIPATYLEVRKALAGDSGLEMRDGFYVLKNRVSLVDIRRARYLVTEYKLKTARRRLRLLQWLPGIQLICLANNIGNHNFRSGGDTDLFIVTRQGRLWFVKFCATVITQLLGWRPSKRKNADQLCLSFLVDDSALDMARFCMPEDKYFVYWLAGLTPLYGDPRMYGQLLASNSWLNRTLPNWSSSGATPRRRFAASAPSSSPLFGKLPERLAKKIQQYFMSPAIKALANKDSRVVMNDHILKLHTVDRREYFKTEFSKKLALYL